MNQKVSESLRGKFGEQSRRWKGNDASYIAKHMWITKHYGRASECVFNPEHQAKRYEWANISGEYLRDISDYIQLCPSCHRKIDADRISTERGKGIAICKHGHILSTQNVYIDPRGFRTCKECRINSSRRWRENHEAN